jgi:putative DNA primase/helicase
MTDKIKQFPPPEAVSHELPFKPDDDQLALHVAAQWRSSMSFFHGKWHEYTNGTWQARDNHEMKVALRTHLRQYRKQGVQVSQRKVNGVLLMLEDDLWVSDRLLMEVQPETRRYINLRNGLFNLETMTLEPHRSGLYFTHQLDFDFDEDADCPIFRQYINRSLVYPDRNETDFHLVHLVYQALAYSMTARTDLKASFWLLGAPNSGKSTFIAFIRSLMGSLHATLDLNQLGTNRFLLSSIVGKRVVTFTEAERNSVLPDGLYKAMVGGEDEVYADVKNRDAITFKPEAKFWWAMNDAPRTVDRSDAIFNRLIVIPFNRSIPQSERIPDLVAKLSSERAGIFNEILPWYVRLCRAGKFEQVEQSMKKLQEYKAANDTEASYLADRTTRDPNGRVQSQPLYDDYRFWCERNGFRAKNHLQIGSEWERLGLTKSQVHGRFIWHGITLNDE